MHLRHQLMISLLILISPACSLQPHSPSPAVTPSSFPNASKSLSKMGEPISIIDQTNNLQLTVNGIREHPGKGVIKPNQGHKWVVVDLTIVNNGEMSKTFSVVSFSLVDEKQISYEVALLASALEDIKSPTGLINPHQERRGELAFEVPEAAQHLQLLFKPNSGECEGHKTPEKTPKTLNCQPIVIQLVKANR